MEPVLHTRYRVLLYALRRRLIYSRPSPCLVGIHGSERVNANLSNSRFLFCAWYLAKTTRYTGSIVVLASATYARCSSIYATRAITARSCLLLNKDETLRNQRCNRPRGESPSTIELPAISSVDKTRRSAVLVPCLAHAHTCTTQHCSYVYYKQYYRK